MVKKDWVVVLVILALGAFLRFYHITAVPPGLYPDEAMNGNNALEALHNTNFSARGGSAFGGKVFYPDNNGREGLFINIQAVSVWLFGREAWALRVVSAIFGTLTILGVYFVTRELFTQRVVIPAKAGIQKTRGWIPDQVGNNKKAEYIALIASFFLATSYWHLNFSRIGFRAITTPFFLTFGLYFLFRGFRRNNIWDMVWAGVFTGLGFHGYIAFRFVPFIIAVPILWQLWKWWRARNEPRASTACTPCAVMLFLFITFVAALPIGWYFLQHPADFTGRSRDVSILSAPAPILEFIKTNVLTLGMLFIRGDCNDRHNYACRPELNLLVGIFFVIGLSIAFRSLLANTRNFQFSIFNFSAKGGSASGGQSIPNDSKLKIGISTTLAWLAFMSLPATLTREGLPHALRSIGMIPPIMILSGLGAYAAFQFARNRTSQKIALTLVILACGYIAGQTYYNYFIAWAPRGETANAFGTDLWHLGQYLEKTSPDIKKYVIVDLNSDQNGGLPVVAQSVAFATDTFRQEERLQKNLTYILSRDALLHIQISDGNPLIIAPLQKNDPEVIGIIREKFPEFKEVPFEDFFIFKNF